jgi:hypothetical protein
MLIETTSGGAMIPLVFEPLLKATTSNPPSCAGNHYRLRHQEIKKGHFFPRVVLSRMCRCCSYEHAGSPKGCQASDLQLQQLTRRGRPLAGCPGRRLFGAT